METEQFAADLLDNSQLLSVLDAMKNGDFSVRMPLDCTGIADKIADTVNEMIDRHERLTSELKRVSTVVGKEGKTAQRAVLDGARGAWKDGLESFNDLIVDLVQPTTEVARVIGAVANGDLSQTMSLEIDGRPLTGEFFRTANTINTMVDQLNGFASEVTRVAREVGTEGKLGGQAEVKGVAGTWKDLTDSVNFMASNLTGQVRNIAEVSTAIANGDLSKKITAEAKGEILELKNTINTMLDQLNSFASEVTRVAREVGTEGKLGGQAEVKGVGGTWKDLTDSVNFMASNLTGQVRNIAEVTTAVANGDLSRKITAEAKGEILELKNTVNTMLDQLNGFASEVTRVAREVGTEGKLGGQALVRGVSGTWKDLTDSVNSMASNLTGQVRNIAEVTTAVANGDLSKKITVDVRGEILELKSTVNTMVDQLNGFASEVTRVAREVGTEGKLGGQAVVRGVSGTWKDLTDSVNSMASNLTSQVRNIARVVTAVANGDLRLKLVLEAKGEIAELADTINAMIDTLATFADQVTTVAREVGIEGKLGGQASVPGAAGTWRDLTDNVNRLAANLTTQVRAIAEVATAVTAGDLSRAINVEAAGEVAVLKDNINQMIRNLADTTRINTEQDWLKTNVARFTRLLQGQRDLLTVSRLILSELAPLVSVQHGLFYFLEDIKEGSPVLKMQASYGFEERRHLANRFQPGQGLVGQCLLEKQRILLIEVPDDYIKISSGLGQGTPRTIVVLPVLFEGEVLAIIELASFNQFSPIHLTFLDQLTESIGIVLNTLQASARTEELLKQSQSLTQELQNGQLELQETNERLEQQAKSLQASEELLRTQQEDLRQANTELEDKAKLLAEQNREVERKNREIEVARQELEEKAEQLTLSSKYKSEFLANMSHELRTPLTSMLVLSQLLADNPDGNLTPKQQEYSATVYSSGTDLLTLINEILDLAKIESGQMEVQIAAVPFTSLRHYVERTFRELAADKGLGFTIELDQRLPQAIYTDSQRLQQILRNLLSNAFKFTQRGEVSLRIEPARGGWSAEQKVLNRADTAIAFIVRDTGIGISPNRQALVFEAFQQADGTTSRQYGDTGLGLSISREIAALLQGEITLASRLSEGSTFTLYLPLRPLESLRLSGQRAPGLTHLHQRTQAVVDKLAKSVPETAVEPAPANEEMADDRAQIQAGDPCLLIVDDDSAFAGLLLDQAHAHGLKGIVASCAAPVFDLARKYQPAVITLDIRLPDSNGLILLDRLKHDAETRHIPVWIISVTDEAPYVIQLGVANWIKKPLKRADLEQAFVGIKEASAGKVRHLLAVMGDAAERQQIAELIGNSDVQVQAVANPDEGLQILKTRPWDCVVIDMSLPRSSGLSFIRAVRERSELPRLPIIAYSRKTLTRRQRSELQRLADTLVIDGMKSAERLLYKTTLLLGRPQSNLPPVKQQILERLRLCDPDLSGKKVLVVDDDARNVFALTSLLESHQMKVLYAENALDGLATLDQTPDIDIVLMDVMMPQMDGFEAMRRLHREERFRHLPIIAVTAKAMKGDRELCLEAGAWDYIAKPVDNQELLSRLRVWLNQRLGT